MAIFKLFQDSEGRTFRALEGSDRETELLANPNLVELIGLREEVSEDNNVRLSRKIITISGRFEIDNDDDWASWSDPNFGPNLQDWDLDLGNGNAPIVDWDGLGMMFPAGTILKRIVVKVRGNNNDIDTIETFARVHDVDLTQGLAIDSAAEIGAFDIEEANQIVNLDPVPANALDMQVFEINLADYTFINHGDLHLFMRSTPGSTTGNRQLRCTMFIEYILPELI